MTRVKIHRLWINSDNKASGCCLYYYNDDRKNGYIANLKTEKKSQRRGYATRMVKQAENIFIFFGFSAILLKVKKNSWQEKWYRQLGYSKVNNNNGRLYDYLIKNLK